MSIPSAIYLLLTNPTWGANDAYKSVLEGTRQAWNFDPNETHDGVSLGQRLLMQWDLQQQNEEKLIDIVDALLVRGMDHKRALDPIGEKQQIYWKYYAGVRSLLAGKGTLDYPQVLLGARLLNLMGQGLNVADTCDKAQVLLQGVGEWNSKLHGMNAVAWLALQSCKEGEMTGWSASPSDRTEEYYARRLRTMRGISKACSPGDVMDEDERFCLACGMLLAVSYVGDSKSGKEAAAPMVQQALELLSHIKSENLPQAFDRVVSREDFAFPEFRFSLAMAAIKGLAPRLQQQDHYWSLIARALPYLHDEDGVYLGGGNSLDNVLRKEKGLPTTDFLDALEPNDRNHDALLRILVSSFDKRSYGEGAEFQARTLDFFHDLKQWAEKGDLTAVDVEHYLQSTPSARYQTKFVEVFERYSAEIATLNQQHRIEQTTPRPQAARVKHRI